MGLRSSKPLIQPGAEFGDDSGGNFVAAAKRAELSLESRLGQERFQPRGVFVRQHHVLIAVALEELETGLRRSDLFHLGLVDDRGRQQDQSTGFFRRMKGEIGGDHAALAESAEDQAIPRYFILWRIQRLRESFDHGHRLLTGFAKAGGDFRAGVALDAGLDVTLKFHHVELPPGATGPARTDGNFQKALGKQKIAGFFHRQHVGEAGEVSRVGSVAVKENDPGRLGILDDVESFNRTEFAHIGDKFYNVPMKLQDLFRGTPGLTTDAIPAVDVTGLCNDARKVSPGAVFIAIKGQKLDGHDFIPEAIARGAVALVVSDRAKIPSSFQGFVFQTGDTRAGLDVLASRFHRDPGKEMFCVGVTGTNGKTSTTYLLESIFNAGGLPTGVIGTVNHHLGARVWPSDMTTPDPLYLQQRLREFRDAGAAAVAMEISSHALDQRRADSVPFNTTIFTNLTRDHLDYHRTMEDYFQAKQRMFLDLLWKTSKHPCYAVVNVDDDWGRRLRIADPAVLWTFGRSEGDFRWTIRERDFARTRFHVETPAGAAEIDFPMGGEHNVQNAVGALAAGLSAGIPLDKIVQGLESFEGVPGRLQTVTNERGLSVFVDYAHSPDALDNVLGALGRVRETLKSTGKIWTVFGCGGDRDKGKRPLMLKSALDGSDRVVVTSDNPRTEDPQAIIQDILVGAGGEEARIDILSDRGEAIRFAISQAKRGDVVLIAGKGHEDYQIVGTTKAPFSDVETAREALKRG